MNKEVDNSHVDDDRPLNMLTCETCGEYLVNGECEDCD